MNTKLSNYKFYILTEKHYVKLNWKKKLLETLEIIKRNSKSKFNQVLPKSQYTEQEIIEIVNMIQSLNKLEFNNLYKDLIKKNEHNYNEKVIYDKNWKKLDSNILPNNLLKLLLANDREEQLKNWDIKEIYYYGNNPEKTNKYIFVAIDNYYVTTKKLYVWYSVIENDGSINFRICSKWDCNSSNYKNFINYALIGKNISELPW